MPLTNTAIKQAQSRLQAYKLFDEKGLFLSVQPTGGRLWRLKYRYGGKEKKLALGAFPETGLKEAREKRDEARKLLGAGIDPSAQRKIERLGKALRGALESPLAFAASGPPNWVTSNNGNHGP